MPLARLQNRVLLLQAQRWSSPQGWPSHDATTQVSSDCFPPDWSEAVGQVEIEIAQINKQIVDGKGEFSIPLGQETDTTLEREVRE